MGDSRFNGWWENLGGEKNEYFKDNIGLATGIDTDEMVQSLMKAERIKVNKVEHDKQPSTLAAGDV